MSKNKIYLFKTGALFLFFLLFTNIFHIPLQVIFSFQESIFLFLGTFIFSVPSVFIAYKKKNYFEILSALTTNTIKTGFVMSVILIIYTVSNPLKFAQDDFSPIILVVLLLRNCRPLLYSLIIWIVLLPHIKTKKTESNHLKVLNLSILSRREQEVARLIENGLTNSEIADSLFISVSTVKRHIANIFTKINITSRNDLQKINEINKLY